MRVVFSVRKEQKPHILIKTINHCWLYSELSISSHMRGAQLLLSNL